MYKQYVLSLWNSCKPIVTLHSGLLWLLMFEDVDFNLTVPKWLDPRPDRKSLVSWILKSLCDWDQGLIVSLFALTCPEKAFNLYWFDYFSFFFFWWGIIATVLRFVFSTWNSIKFDFDQYLCSNKYVLSALLGPGYTV